jgi:hypothetical protein
MMPNCIECFSMHNMFPVGNIRARSRERIEAEYGASLRHVLLDLTYRRGLPQTEIAELLGVPLGTVASWIHREGIQAAQLATWKAAELLGDAPGEVAQ